MRGSNLVFDAEAAGRALEVAPGEAIVVEIVSPRGGHAERPITRWAGA